MCGLSPGGMLALFVCAMRIASVFSLPGGSVVSQSNARTYRCPGTKEVLLIGMPFQPSPPERIVLSEIPLAMVRPGPNSVS